MSKEFHISFFPQNRQITAKAGETVWEIAVRAGVFIRGECGGKGMCGKCRIIADPLDSLSMPSQDEKRMISDTGSKDPFRLACQAKIIGPVTIHIPDTLLGDEPVSGKTDIAGDFSLSPMVRRLSITPPDIATPTENTPFGVAEMITEEIKQRTGQPISFQSFEAIRQLSIPGVMTNEITLVYHEEKGITSVYPGNRKKSLGIALDIGTTSIAAYVCDMSSGSVLFADAELNPQHRYSEDVIGRIGLANRESVELGRLHILLIDAVNALMKRCVLHLDASLDDIDEVTVVGNTVMEHFFAGIHPYHLGVWPYRPATRKFDGVAAKDIGLIISPGTSVFIFPVISGFIGGDALAAVLAESNGYPNDIRLIIDIGTNGEIVLMTPEGIWATSCATGPAFEGGHLSCGMRATAGAIYKVSLTSSEGGFEYHTLGEESGTRPIGICGSGIIDAVAAMHASGTILPNGRLNEEKTHVICDTNGIGQKVILVDKDYSGAGEDIFMTLRDIRQIQLAKAAMAVGIMALLKRAGITRIDTTVLTGAFGVTFDWQHACDIGMFPPSVMESHVEPKINLAGVGGIKALLDKNERMKTYTLLEQVRFVELSTDADFSNAFAEAVRFPNIA